MNSNMNSNMQKVRKVFFFIKSDTMTETEMNGFARRQIFNIDSSANIRYRGPTPDNKGITYNITPSSNEKTNEIIHNLNFKEFEKCQTFGFLERIKGKYEAVITGASECSTCRDFFLAMEKFGPISRVTPCRSRPGVAWVVFIYKHSLENAIASETKIGENTVNIAAEVNNSKYICKRVRPTSSSQFQVVSA